MFAIREAQSELTLNRLREMTRSTLEIWTDSFDLTSLVTGFESRLISYRSDLDLSGLTSFQRGNIVLRDGGSLTTPVLDSIDGTSLYATGGSQITFDGVTSYDFAATANYEDRFILADGPDSSITLPNLTTIVGGTRYDNDLVMGATGGGLLDLPLVTEIVDGESEETRQRLIRVVADGFQSVVKLDSLTDLSDINTDQRSRTVCQKLGNRSCTFARDRRGF